MQRTNIKKTNPEKTARRVLAAHTMTGDTVRNPAGEDLGKVDEIMIDIPTGRVAYVVLSHGATLGMGGKLFAVPWKLFTVDEDEKEFILDVPKIKLEQAPGFDKDNWPDLAADDWGVQISSYYGTRPYWEEEYPRERIRGEEYPQEKVRHGGGGL